MPVPVRGLEPSKLYASTLTVYQKYSLEEPWETVALDGGSDVDGVDWGYATECEIA